MAEKVYWSFTHHLNSQSSTTITRRGVFIRELKTRSGRGITRFAICQFEGNKNTSKVPYSELTFDVPVLRLRKTKI